MEKLTVKNTTAELFSHWFNVQVVGPLEKDGFTCDSLVQRFVAKFALEREQEGKLEELNLVIVQYEIDKVEITYLASEPSGIALTLFYLFAFTRYNDVEIGLPADKQVQPRMPPFPAGKAKWSKEDYFVIFDFHEAGGGKSDLKKIARWTGKSNSTIEKMHKAYNDRNVDPY